MAPGALPSLRRFAEGARPSGEPGRSQDDDVTDLLRRWRERPEEGSQERLFRAIYPKLRRLAARERGASPTLQITEVVHEAYLRLVDQRGSDWQNRAHFFAIASRVIRRVVVDHLRARGSEKRGGRVAFVPIEEIQLEGRTGPCGLLDLDRALEELASFDENAARLVEMRYFGGLTIEEAALVLRLGRTSAVAKWRAARAWLRSALGARPDDA